MQRLRPTIGTVSVLEDDSECFFPEREEKTLLSFEDEVRSVYELVSKESDEETCLSDTFLSLCRVSFTMRR